MFGDSLQRAPGALPDPVWPPTEEDHSTSRLATNMAGFTLFGWAVKATQNQILMETKMIHMSPEMKAITKRRMVVPSVYLKSALVWAPIGFIYYWARLRLTYTLAKKQKEMALEKKKDFRPKKYGSGIQTEGLPM